MNVPISNGSSRLWWRGALTALVVAVLMGGLAWGRWVTTHIDNYVGGERRGERLSNSEATVMIDKSEAILRSEWDAKLAALEARLDAKIRLYEHVRVVEDQLEILNSRLRQERKP